MGARAPIVIALASPLLWVRLESELSMKKGILHFCNKKQSCRQTEPELTGSLPESESGRIYKKSSYYCQQNEPE